MKVFCIFIFGAWGFFSLSKASSACQQTSANTDSTGCYVDLTVAIDMSSAMSSVANISILVNSVLSDLLPQFNFYETNTAGIAFGGDMSSSMYFSDYSDMCSWLDAEQASITVLGLTPGNLSNVFKMYDDQILRSGRNYKKILVLLTAINDEIQIQAAKSYANNLRAEGVYILVGALGTAASSSSLYQLGDNSFNSTNFTVPSATVINDTCQFGGVTVFPPTPQGSGTTAASSDPRSNQQGTSCSTNTSNAWLDVVYVVDVSNAMDSTALQQLAIQIAGFMKDFTFGQTGQHTTRAALITYSSVATIRYNLTDASTFLNFEKALIKLPTYVNPSDSGVNARVALQTAAALLKSESKNRVQVIVFTASAYNDQGYNGAALTADQIKADGINIFAINFAAEDGGVFGDILKGLSSPGFSYTSIQDDLSAIIPYALTQGGVLTSVTSRDKFDFITDHVIPYLNQTKQVKEFLVGGHKSGAQWMWYDLDGSEYPFGNFPQFNALNPDDQYSFYQKGYGFNYTFRSVGDVAKAYICETRACDADNWCNLN
uniref:VWFA domain-containing protein n=1 Tax=Panagrolaimus sp. ES5 TaxID=591445 RepID=A0AC34FJI6_9BILA